MSKILSILWISLLVMITASSAHAQDTDTWRTAYAGDFRFPAATIQHPDDWRVEAEFIERESRAVFSLESPGRTYTANVAIFWDGTNVGRSAEALMTEAMWNELTRDFVTPQAISVGELNYWEATGFVVDTPIMGIRGYIPTRGTAWLHEGYRVLVWSDYYYPTENFQHDEANPHATMLDILATLTIDERDFPAAPNPMFDAAASAINDTLAPTDSLSVLETNEDGYAADFPADWSGYISLDGTYGRLHAWFKDYRIEVQHLPTQRLDAAGIGGTPEQIVAGIATYIEQDTPPTIPLEFLGGVTSFERDGATYHEIVYRTEPYENYRLGTFLPYLPDGLLEQHIILATGILTLPTGEQFLVQTRYATEARLNPADFWALHEVGRALVLSLRVE